MPAVSRLRPLLHVLVCCAAGIVIRAAATVPEDDPETVVVIYQVKPNDAPILTKVIAEHWNMARRLNLVHASPHILVQGKDQGRPYIMEIFTWRDSSIPDNAPDEITRLWQEMGTLVEDRQGHPGIDFSPVNILTP
ncbi:MAG TPA: hypothetical protein VI653_29810 [Steroidobacteraceae bacterium]